MNTRILRRFSHLSPALLGALVLVALPATVEASPNRETRVSHARELLGRHYGGSVVREGEQLRHVDRHIRSWVKQALPRKWRGSAARITGTLLEESRKHGFDPFFLMAVIRSESSFDPDQRGGAGEIGLMQILPETGKWMADKADIPWRGERTLRDPAQNIRIGAAYLAWLRGRFDSHARLYLAAYNMGQRNVTHALSRNVWPKDYPIRVMNNYVDFYAQLRERRDTSSAGGETRRPASRE